VCILAGTGTVTATVGFLYYKKVHIPRYINRRLFDHPDNYTACRLKYLTDVGYIIDDDTYIQALKRDPQSLLYFPHHLLTLDNILLAVNNVEYGLFRESKFNVIVEKIPEQLFIQNNNLAKKLVAMEPSSIKSIPSIFLTERMVIKAVEKDIDLTDFVLTSHQYISLPDKLIAENKYNKLFDNYLNKCYYSELTEEGPDIFCDETKAKEFIEFLNTIPKEYLTERMIGKIPRPVAQRVHKRLEGVLH
jgi:hypothetical protein